MEILLIVIGIIAIFILFAVINIAIDNSQNTKLLKENHKLLTEIRELLKTQNKDS